VRAASWAPGILAIALAGCGTMADGRGWGEDVTVIPPAERLDRAAAHAVLDPRVWGPLAGAAVFGLTGLDDEVSDWAREEHPVFGSADHAGRVGDDLEATLEWVWIAGMVVTPSGDEPERFVWAKAKGAVIELGAVATTKNLTVVLKKTTGRTRPNQSDDRSFPSAHTSNAFVYGTLTERNLEAISMPRGLRAGLDVGLTGMGAATAWSRVEAGAHYPSDVLFGAALGNFLALFFTRAFLGVDPPPVDLGVRPDPDGLQITARVVF